MACVLLEGYDHLTFAQLGAKYWSSPTGSMQTGRFGGQCLRISSGVSEKTLPSTYSRLYIGVAVRFSTVTANQDWGNFYTAIAGTEVARFRITGAGILQVATSAGTTIVSTTTPLAANTWYYVEITVLQAGASGSAEIRLNGVSEGGPTTGNFGSANMGSVRFIRGSSGTIDYDDVYINDTSGSLNTGFLGEQRVDFLVPTGAGNSTQFTPNAGSNWDRVDDTTPDDDTTYNSDSTVNHKDTYAVGDVSSSSTVSAVQVNHRVRKTDAGARAIATVIRQGGTDYVGDTKPLTSDYLFQSQLYSADPLGSAWTASSVNADEFGTKVVT